MAVSKQARLAEFVRRLLAAHPASNADEAYALLCRTVNEVEDELSGVPNNSDNWRDDGRLYPPQMDRMEVLDDEVRRFQSLKHYTYIKKNGAIEITIIRTGEVFLSKPGRSL